MGARIGLSGRQFGVCVGLGALLWLVAALLLRFLGPMGIYDGMARVWLYLLIIPGTFPFLLMVERVAGLGRAQLFTGVAVVTMAAMFLDGVALAWFPGLYGATVPLHAGAGGTILWGAAVGMALALLRTRPR
jgi:hypothetical protein